MIYREYIPNQSPSTEMISLRDILAYGNPDLGEGPGRQAELSVCLTDWDRHDPSYFSDWEAKDHNRTFVNHEENKIESNRSHQNRMLNKQEEKKTGFETYVGQHCQNIGIETEVSKLGLNIGLEAGVRKLSLNIGPVETNMSQLCPVHPSQVNPLDLYNFQVILLS